ncbi:MAG: hypothetical protein ACI81V_000126 [Lentimonas sp.]|jgi:hypothetical protein
MLKLDLKHTLWLHSCQLVAVLLVLAAVSLALRPLERPAFAAVQAQRSELPLAELEGALGQGIVVGVLGGFRTILADFSWIRLNTAWEKREAAELDALIRLVTTLDPNSVYFWVNSARMLAYDVPHWRIREAGGVALVSEARQAAIVQEQAQQAFVLLAQARKFHPDEPKLYLEVAQIYLNRLKDDALAAEWFLKASQFPGAPYYTARIYAELLRRQGLEREAYEFLKQLHASLPDDPHAQKNVLLERIRELEASLAIPEKLYY